MQSADAGSSGAGVTGDAGSGSASGEAVLTDASWDERVNDALSGVAKPLTEIIFFKVELIVVEFTLVIVLLVVAAVFFTIYFRFINLTGMWHGIRLALGREETDDDAPGEITHFQALCTALSGTVGIGNIGAMAFAIASGGPGALFWLVVAGFLGMTTKFAECTLGVKYLAKSIRTGRFPEGRCIT